MSTVQKKTVSVIGCCMARNIFNTPQCQEVFNVNNFAFQVVPYGFTDTSFDIPVEKIEEIQKGQFEQRVLQYNLNKTLKKGFESNVSDYIVIDLMACSFVLSEITFNNKKTIVRMGHGENVLKKMSQDDWFTQKGFSYRQLHYSELNSSYIYRCLDEFALWIDELYRRDQIIICRPHIPSKYLNKNLEVCSYSEDKLNRYKKDQEYVDEITNYIIKKLTGCLVFDFPKNIVAEDYQFTEGLPYHYTNMDYVIQGDKMIKLLDLSIDDYYTLDLDPASYVMEMWVKKYCEARKMLIDLEEKVANVHIKDQFIGTSISSVYTQPFGKNLYRVADIYEKVLLEQKDNEELWKDKYLQLREDYIKIEEALLEINVLDRLRDADIETIKNAKYNQDLLCPEMLVGEYKG